MNNTNRKLTPLAVFFIVVLLTSAVVEALIITKGIGILYAVLMWLPALAALAANLRKVKQSGEKCSLLGFFRQGGFRRCGVKYIPTFPQPVNAPNSDTPAVLWIVRQPSVQDY